MRKTYFRFTLWIHFTKWDHLVKFILILNTMLFCSFVHLFVMGVTGLYLKSCDQRDCEDWVETCKIILSGLRDDPEELLVHSRLMDGKEPADSLETQVIRHILKIKNNQISGLILTSITRYKFILYVFAFSDVGGDNRRVCSRKCQED